MRQNPFALLRHTLEPHGGQKLNPFSRAKLQEDGKTIELKHTIEFKYAEGRGHLTNEQYLAKKALETALKKAGFKVEEKSEGTAAYYDEPKKMDRQQLTISHSATIPELIGLLKDREGLLMGELMLALQHYKQAWDRLEPDQRDYSSLISGHGSTLKRMLESDIRFKIPLYPPSRK